MNLLKTFWNWIVTLKADGCCAESHDTTPVEVEEAEEAKESCGDVFAHLCREAGIKQRDLDNTDAVALFEKWYPGGCAAEDILAAMADFKKAHPAVNAKLQGKI